MTVYSKINILVSNETDQPNSINISDDPDVMYNSAPTTKTATITNLLISNGKKALLGFFAGSILKLIGGIMIAPIGAAILLLIGTSILLSTAILLPLNVLSLVRLNNSENHLFLPL